MRGSCAIIAGDMPSANEWSSPRSASRVTDDAQPLERIHVRLEQDDEGYPPYGVETLWAEMNGEIGVIDSIPFFTDQIAPGDSVLTERGDAR